MSVKIFSSKNCGWAIRNYAALIEKKVAFEIVPAKDQKGNFTGSFIEATPMRLTPVMVDDDVSVFDSLLINEYIDERYDNVKLLPESPAERAKARSVVHFCDHILLKTLSKCFKETSDQNKNLEKLKQHLSELQARYFSGTHGPYFFGTRFSLVDIAYYNFFSTYDYFNDEGIEEEGLLNDNLLSWRRNIMERPSIVEAQELQNKIVF